MIMEKKGVKVIKKFNEPNEIIENLNDEDTKQYYNDKNCFSAEKILKIKKMSNEDYLKQILGTRYRDVEDEFISYAEKKFMKNLI